MREKTCPACKGAGRMPRVVLTEEGRTKRRINLSGQFVKGTDEICGLCLGRCTVPDLDSEERGTGSVTVLPPPRIPRRKLADRVREWSEGRRQVRWPVTKELAEKVEQYQKSLGAFLTILEAKGNFRERQEKLRELEWTEVQLQEYLQVMKAEILLMPVDAFSIDAFLECQDEKARRRSWLERWLTRKRASLTEQYQRFTREAKMMIRPMTGGKIQIAGKEITYSEEKADVPEDGEGATSGERGPVDNAPAEAGDRGRGRGPDVQGQGQRGVGDLRDEEDGGHRSSGGVDSGDRGTVTRE